jgi:hypothetical protein
LMFLVLKLIYLRGANLRNLKISHLLSAHVVMSSRMYRPLFSV